MTYVKCRSQSSEMLATFPSKRMTSFNMAGDQWHNICGAVELVGRQGRVVCMTSPSPCSHINCQQSYAYHNHWSSKLKSMQPYLLCPETINWLESACAACAAPVSGGALGMHSAHGLENPFGVWRESWDLSVISARCLHMALIENGVYHCIAQNPLVECWVWFIIIFHHVPILSPSNNHELGGN